MQFQTAFQKPPQKLFYPTVPFSTMTNLWRLQSWCWSILNKWWSSTSSSGSTWLWRSLLCCQPIKSWRWIRFISCFPWGEANLLLQYCHPRKLACFSSKPTLFWNPTPSYLLQLGFFRCLPGSAQQAPDQSCMIFSVHHRRGKRSQYYHQVWIIVIILIIMIMLIIVAAGKQRRWQTANQTTSVMY